MAKKLTPEELAKTKADFDPPAEKPKKKNEAKAKHAGGRPPKAEETKVTSFRLPPRTVQRLRVLAALKGVSAADIIVEFADKAKVPGLDK